MSRGAPGSQRLRLLGRDFDGFRGACAAHAAAWPHAGIDATWLGLPELQARVLDDHDIGADLVVVPADWLPALAASGRIVALEWFDGSPWPRSFVEGVSYAGRSWGVPFHDGPQLLFTRRDLGPAPRTWGDLVALAEERHGLVGALGTAASGTVLAGAPDGHNNVYDFALHLWRCGGDLLALEEGPALEALSFLHRLATTVVPDDAHDLDSNASGQAFAAGRVAVAVNWAGYAELARAGAVAGTFETSLAPTHDNGTPTTTVNAFWATALTRECVVRGASEEAQAYLRHASSAAMDVETVRAGASGARLSTWADADVLAREPSYALFAAAHQQSRPLPRIPQLPRVVDVLSELVDAVVWRGEQAGPSLDRARRAVAALVGTDAPRGRQAVAR